MSDEYDGKHRKYPQPNNADDNAQWVRDRIAEAGLTDEVEAAAIERVAQVIGRVPVGPDGPAHPGEVCVCCNGSATTLRYDQHTEQLVCNDRDLCRDTMIYEHMLATVNGA